MFQHLKALLVSPNNKTQKEKLCVLVKSGERDRESRKEYIGETARSLEVKFKEHQTANILTQPSQNTPPWTTGHKYTLANVNVLVKQDSDFKRKVKVAFTIHKKKTAVIRD